MMQYPAAAYPAARGPAYGRASAQPRAEEQFDVVQSRFAMRLFALLAIIAALTLVIHFGGRAIGRSLSTGGHSASTEVHRIVIGNNVLSVPENMIRFVNQRRDGMHQRLDLYMLFPQMTGYAPERRDWFNDQAPDRRLVFVSIDESQMSRDMSGRYDPIYSVITNPAGETAPSGLERHAFLASSGYSNEELLVGPAEPGGSRFVVRCLSGPDASLTLSACERDIHVGDHLSLTYRFPRSMLGEWRTLEANIRGFANTVIAAPGS